MNVLQAPTDGLGPLVHSLWDSISVEKILAIVAIVFATKQYFDAREANKRMADHSKRMTEHSIGMQDIAKSMSTRYIGKFPDNMPEVKNIVEIANATLNIMVDYFGYGHFSSPAVFRSYLSLLLEKHRAGVNLRIIVYAENLLSLSNESEFPAEEFKELEGTKEFQEFFNVHCKGLQRPRDAEAFRALLIERQHAYLAEALVAGVKIRTVSHELVVFLWSEDSEDAVFSFRGAGLKDDREVAFRTRDGKLIDTFSGLFEKIWKTAQPLSLPPMPPQTFLETSTSRVDGI